MKSALQHIGIRGHKLQMQNKETMASGMLVFDDNENICNRKLLQNTVNYVMNTISNKRVKMSNRLLMNDMSTNCISNFFDPHNRYTLNHTQSSSRF